MVIETGLSDFHKMSLTVMKVFYKKPRLKTVRYRIYHNFDKELFINEVKNSIEQEYCQNQSLEFGSFKKKVDKILQKHAPLKKRYVMANQAPFIDKNNNKHIMKRSRLRNKFLNTKSDIILTVKVQTKITLIEKKYKDSSTEPSEEIISDEEKIVEIFDNFFVNIVPSLKTANHNCNIDFQKNDDPVLNAINKYKYDSSIFEINSKIEPENIFSFTIVKHEDILRKTKNLNVSEHHNKVTFQLKC